MKIFEAALLNLVKYTYLWRTNTVEVYGEVTITIVFVAPALFFMSLAFSSVLNEYSNIVCL